MGTSKGYDAPTTPQWASAKNDITRAAQIPNITPQRIGSMLGKYIVANGGAGAMASGGGALGSGKSAQRVARNLGSFAERASAIGFREALREAGLDRPETRTPSEVCAFLTNHLSGGDATIDDADARAATNRLVRELMEQADPDASEDANLAALQPQALPETLNLYFGYYLFEQFCRVSYDRLVERVGADQADAFLGDIERYIFAEVRDKGRSRDLSTVDWRSTAGSAMADGIFQDVLDIFGGGAE